MSRCRYAPSPTGRLHLGNLRTALLAWLQCRLAKGTFVLRIDDIDTARNVPGALQQIIEDLKWIGIDWDEGPDVGGPGGPYLQSQRAVFYQKAFVRLQQTGRLFPCVCSRKDIDMALSAPHQRQSRNIYPGTCRPRQSGSTINTAQIASALDFTWRYCVGDDISKFDDIIYGKQTLALAQLVGDFVVKRRDGLHAYHLASVVDDQLMGITDILRGEDLIESSHRQLSLIYALNYREPDFWHVPLMLDNQKRRLSKRDGSASLKQWHGQDKSAEQLIGYLAFSCGLIDKNQAIDSVELLNSLSLDQFKQKIKPAQNP